MYSKEIYLEEMKRIELNTLKQIHEICVSQDFRYFLIGGTLLGAVRHKGFIPWDDDIDIGMPRPDYERFIEYCSSNDVPFKLVCNKTDPNYGYLFAKAVDKNTVLIEENANKDGAELGIYVDIFPIDGLGNTFDEAISRLNKTRFNRELLVAANWKKFFRSKTRPIYQEPIRIAFFLMSRMCSFKKLIKKIESQYDVDGFDKFKYAGCVCGSYRNKEVVEQSVYSEYVELPFEDASFYCPKDYDKYLKCIYGDYMKLPPKDKQVSHHMFVAYYKD